MHRLSLTVGLETRLRQTQSLSVSQILNGKAGSSKLNKGAKASEASPRRASQKTDRGCGDIIGEMRGFRHERFIRCSTVSRIKSEISRIQHITLLIVMFHTSAKLR